MDCCICASHATFECKCTNCGICLNCIVKHITSDSQKHEIIEISEIHAVAKCDNCKNKFARVKCLCQDEKKRFCIDCIPLHLEINTSHCIEPICSSTVSRETLKNQEKRRKVEYLAYEIKRNLESLKEFRAIVKKSRAAVLEGLDKSVALAKAQAGKCEKDLSNLSDELVVKVGQAGKEDPLVEMFINQVDANDIEKKEKNLNLLDFKINTENALKAIKTNCRIALINK